MQGDGWQRVQMEFDWAAMRVHCFVNGEAMRKENAFLPGVSRLDQFAGLIGPEALPFGPEAHETVSEDEGGALHASLRGGFRRIYLFTWLEADGDPEEAPEVRIGDMWVEPGPAPRRAALPLAKAGPVAEAAGQDEGAGGEEAGDEAAGGEAAGGEAGAGDWEGAEAGEEEREGGGGSSGAHGPSAGDVEVEAGLVGCALDGW